MHDIDDPSPVGLPEHAEFRQVQLLNECFSQSDGVILIDVVVDVFGKQEALTQIQAVSHIGVAPLPPVVRRTTDPAENYAASNRMPRGP